MSPQHRMPASLIMMALVFGYARVTALACCAAAAISGKSAMLMTGMKVCSFPGSSCSTS